MTDKARLYLYDTTLRDGAQTSGIDFSVEEKIIVARLIEEMGFSYIEGGYPGANPTDDAFFSEKRVTKARFAAFGMTKRPGVSLSNDPGVAALLAAPVDAVTFVAKSWDYHVDVALKTTLEDNLDCIRQSVEAAVKAGREAIVDCEHFFDGFKANPDYALACAKTAFEAGARWIVLCDTNGGSMPHEIAEIVLAVTKTVPGDRLGIHAHDDTGQAVANSLAAIRAGVRQVQGTLNGIGERCGNANLTTILPTLVLKDEYASRYDTGVTAEQLKTLTQVSRAFDEIINRAPNRHAPYVGLSAFATKAGIHASAILKDPRTYEHVSPESVGNRRRLLVSDQAGRSNLFAELDRLGIVYAKDDRRLTGLLSELKEREARGYSYEAADASFELLALRHLGGVPHFYDVISYRTMVESRINAVGERVVVTEAVVKVKVDDEILMSVAEGNGPVNALDQALRKDIGKYQAEIAALELVDYKVRILNGGTGAVTRVLIESLDRATGRRWSTVGVSANIVEASFEALDDSITYKLLKNGHAGA